MRSAECVERGACSGSEYPAHAVLLIRSPKDPDRFPEALLQQRWTCSTRRMTCCTAASVCRDMVCSQCIMALVSIPNNLTQSCDYDYLCSQYTTRYHNHGYCTHVSCMCTAHTCSRAETTVTDAARVHRPQIVLTENKLTS